MTNPDKPIYVTSPYLPPLEEFIPYLEEIWDSKILTNKGPFHQKLERALCDYLGVEHLALFANGTLALVTALQAMVGEEVILLAALAGIPVFVFKNNDAQPCLSVNSIVTSYKELYVKFISCQASGVYRKIVFERNWSAINSFNTQSKTDL